MITIELHGVSVTVPSLCTSQRHYADLTSAELMRLGMGTRGLLDKATGAKGAAMRVQLHTIERELMRRGVVHAYSEKSQEITNLIVEACLGKVEACGTG